MAARTRVIVTYHVKEAWAGQLIEGLWRLRRAAKGAPLADVDYWRVSAYDRVVDRGQRRRANGRIATVSVEEVRQPNLFSFLFLCCSIYIDSVPEGVGKKIGRCNGKRRRHVVVHGSRSNSTSIDIPWHGIGGGNGMV
jgi:hypothetical protein